MSSSELEIIDRRKFGGLTLKDQFKVGSEFDPETQTQSEWKEKVAAQGFKYGAPEPLFYNILVRQHGAEHHKHTRGFGLNIEIPESYRQRPGVGVVVAIGSSVTDVKPGDLVKFGLLSEEVDFEGEKFQLLDVRDCKYKESVYTEAHEDEVEG
jgi:co-chaperonin GroES (HSP10)